MSMYNISIFLIRTYQIKKTQSFDRKKKYMDSLIKIYYHYHKYQKVVLK